jgi:hypothetical protein
MDLIFVCYKVVVMGNEIYTQVGFITFSSFWNLFVFMFSFTS